MRLLWGVVALVALVLGGGIRGEAADRVLIRDLQADPGKYLNVTVELRGEVVQVASEGQPTRGTYDLRDESDRTIVVRSRDLPAPGRSVIVTGLLTQEGGVTKYSFRELKRSEPGFFSEWGMWEFAVVGASLLVAVLCVTLVVVLVRPAARSPKGLEAPTAQAPASAPPAERTVPLSSATLDAISAPQKTTRLPRILAEIQVLTGPKAGSKMVLSEESLIGRNSGSLPLGDTTVSSEHARITFRGDRYELLNLSQTNPTRVNGQPVAGTVDLKDGDEVVAGAVKLLFKLIG